MDSMSQITREMIKTAVKRGISDIEKDPNRTIRNLVDLGIHLATGRFQQDFFRIAKQLLSQDDSPYYSLLHDVVSQVDPQILQNFGVNLGYNAWTYGANVIRDHERRYKHNVPWTIVFDLWEETENHLDEAEISDLIDQGVRIGIFCYMFFLGKHEKRVQNILNMLGAHKDCCYFLFMEPEIITVDILEEYLQAKNMAFVLKMGEKGIGETDIRISELLHEKRCLYGTYCFYDNSSIENIIRDEYIKKLLNLHGAFFFLIRKQALDQGKQALFTAFMKKAKYAGDYPLYMIDFYEDLSYVDRVISVEDCFIAINANGDIAIDHRGKRVKDINTKTHSLKNILKETMPKTKYIHSDG